MAKKRWRVRVRKSVEVDVDVDVEADDQDRAKTLADDRAKKGQHSKPALPQVPGIEILGVEPLLDESDFEDIDYSELS